MNIKEEENISTASLPVQALHRHEESSITDDITAHEKKKKKLFANCKTVFIFLLVFFLWWHFGFAAQHVDKKRGSWVARWDLALAYCHHW